MTEKTRLFQFDLVAPDKHLCACQAEMVVVPGVEGDLGLMAQSAPIISELRPGVVPVYRDGTRQALYFIFRGLAETDGHVLTVLTLLAYDLSQFPASAAQAALKEVRQASPETIRSTIQDPRLTPEHYVAGLEALCAFYENPVY